jgi:flagellin-specific chaperone FliS
MIDVTLATGFDRQGQEEKFETVNLSPQQAKEIIESLLSKLDYDQAKEWIDSQKNN